MILMVGVAGSGKSTQSEYLAETEGWKWLSMGQILRERITGELREEMNSGKLLGDEQVEAILKEELSSTIPGKRVILDGFPRRPEQSLWLIETLSELDDKIEAVIHIHAQKEVVLKRLLERGRQDDVDEAINARFEEYEKQVKPLLKNLKGQGITALEINGEQPPEEVFKEILGGLKKNGIKL